MFKSKKYLLFTITIITILIATACGQGPDAEATIQTAVAQTVAAQNTEQASHTATPAADLFATPTPLDLSLTLTPLADLASPTPTSGSSARFECAKASLVGENDNVLPDGVVLKPGEKFTKTWYIQNTSPCVWNTDYKIVFWNGNIMGGGYVYNLPQATAPGQTVPISLVLTAPDSSGDYRSEWKLQTPDKINFGVGMYDAAFYTHIVVSDSNRPPYGILSVNYNITREPEKGCPFNIWYTVHATITVSGPYEFDYRWEQSDGNNSQVRTLYLDKAGSITLTRGWKVSINDSHNDRWMRIVVTDPVYREYDKAIWPFECK